MKQVEYEEKFKFREEDLFFFFSIRHGGFGGDLSLPDCREHDCPCGRR